MKVILKISAALMLLSVLLLAVFFILENNYNRKPVSEVENETPAITTKNTSIFGEVNNPGDYQIEEESTLFELVYLAGGLTDKADLDEYRPTQLVYPFQEYVIEADDAYIEKKNINGLSSDELYEIVNHYLPKKTCDNLANEIRIRDGISDIKEIGTTIKIENIGEKRLECIYKYFYAEIIS